MSIDTVNDLPPRVQYVASAAQTVFPYPFPIFQNADLVVEVDGAVQTLVTHYNVSGATDDTGGNVTFVTGRTAGQVITIYRQTVIERDSDFQLNGPMFSESVNDEFDKLTIIAQEQRAATKRCLRLPFSAEVADADIELAPIDNWLDKYIMLDSTGKPVPAAIVAGTITQSILGALLHPTTDAENAAGVTPINKRYVEGTVDRYATNTTPGTTDMAAAIQAAVDVAHAKAFGGAVMFLPGMNYRAASAITYPATSQRIHMYGNGANLKVDHNGDGIVWLATNENYSGHTISDLTITGPNGLDFSATWTSTGSGINMNRDTTTNVVTAYNNRLRNVTVQGFKYGVNLQAVIGLNCTDCYFIFNEEGVRMDGGQTNGNCWTNCHIRYNRKRGIASTGRSGGSLTSCTNNKFIGCLIESNVPSTAVGGGTVPTDSVGVYLNNSYDFVFLGCYSENHAASIYLSGGSKGHKFIAHRLASGLGRLDTVYLSGAGVWNNYFDLHADSLSFTEVNIRSDHADQQFNTFTGNGINFVESGEVLGKLDYTDVKPSLAFATTRGYGLIRMPSQGYVSNVDSSVVTGIGTGAATLTARGLGEIAFGSGITSNTTITTVSGLRPHSFVVLRGTQNSFQCNLSGTAFGLIRSVNVDLRTGMEIVLWVGGDGTPREVGRNFETSAGVYTVTNGSADRNLNVTADTLAQVAAVLGTLIGDLQTRGLLS